MTTIHDLDTPAALVEVETMMANINAMARHARRIGVSLRPHVKTHKSVAIARLQRDAGAAGLTVATLREAETMAAAGFDDLLVAYPPVGAWRARRFAALCDNARITFVIDDLEAARSVASVARRLGMTARCLWEIDCGAKRCGSAPGRASVDGAERAAEMRGIEIAGFLTFPGHAYGASSEAELDAAAADEERAVRATIAAASGDALRAGTRSGGSTPTASRVGHDTSLSELRPGNYVFHDATQVALGVATHEQCAFTVLATVVSRPNARRAVIDAGSKAVGKESMTPNARGFATVAGRADLVVTRLYEEHGLIESDDEIAGLAVGDRIEVLPNHACAAANLHDVYVLRRGEELVDLLAVQARGWRGEGELSDWTTPFTQRGGREP
jgi:D-serine deaminase-like pyridoxal phosphate-dependent protein